MRTKGEMHLEISSRQFEKATVFDVTGDIDLANSPAVRKALLREVKDKRTPRVVMNLSKVRYIDSSGVASLVEGITFTLTPACNVVSEMVLPLWDKPVPAVTMPRPVN